MQNTSSFVQFKDLPNFQSMFGNIGSSWNNPVPNDLYIKGVPKNIVKLFATADIKGNIGVGTDDLQTVTLPATTFRQDGAQVKFLYAGGFATNDNDKRIQILFDGQVFEDFGAFDFDAGLWRVEGDYTRIDATHIRATSFGLYGEPLVADEGVISGTPDIIYLARNTVLTVSNLDSNPVVLKVTGTATANDDITQNLTWLDLIRF
jgi:hypothetical protein